MPLNDRQENKLQDLIRQLEELSEQTDIDGNVDILGAIYDLSERIYEQYPELEEEEGEEE